MSLVIKNILIKIIFQIYLPFLLNSFVFENKVVLKSADKEFLKKEEELLLENYSS